MRRLLLGSFAAGLLVLGAGVSSASPGAETGEGKDQMCERTVTETGPDGKETTTTETYPCPTPVDRTADYDNAVPVPAPVAAGAEGTPPEEGGVFVQIGDEGEPNSVGRASAYGNAGDQQVEVYAEDYTEGNQVANAVETVNELTGCRLLPPDEGEPCGTPGEDDSPSDAVLIHN